MTRNSKCTITALLNSIFYINYKFLLIIHKEVIIDLKELMNSVLRSRLKFRKKDIHFERFYSNQQEILKEN